jgi:hypothetical protein
MAYITLTRSYPLMRSTMNNNLSGAEILLVRVIMAEDTIRAPRSAAVMAFLGCGDAVGIADEEAVQRVVLVARVLAGFQSLGQRTRDGGGRGDRQGEQTGAEKDRHGGEKAML